MKSIIKTKRLILRELLPSDQLGMYALDSNPDVHQYLGNKPIKSLEKAAEVIAHVRSQYEKYGIGRWALVEMDSDEFVGWAGLKYEWNPRESCYFYDLGYRLRKEFWGKGYAYEASIPALNYAFKTMKLDEIFASAHIENGASIAILKKLGFTFIEEYFYDHIIPCNWYRFGRQDWEQLMKLKSP